MWRFPRGFSLFSIGGYRLKAESPSFRSDFGKTVTWMKVSASRNWRPRIGPDYLSGIQAVQSLKKTIYLSFLDKHWGSIQKCLELLVPVISGLYTIPYTIIVVGIVSQCTKVITITTVIAINNPQLQPHICSFYFGLFKRTIFTGSIRQLYNIQISDW